jgi:thiamine transport system permease protein
MKQISAILDRVPQKVFDAAKLLSPSPLQAVFRVYLPLCFKGCLTGGAFAFAISAGDASLPLMLSVRGFETLPLFLFRLAGSYRFAEAAACGVILAVITGFIFFLRDSSSGTAAQRRFKSGCTE